MDQHISLADLSILLVEPSETQSKIICSMLTGESVGQIEAVSSVADAMQRLNEHTVDLVISAMYFGDGTALDLLMEMKKQTNLKDIPFMLVSSEFRPSKLEEYKQSGVVAILPKPFEPIHLQRALQATVDVLNTEEVDLELFDIRQVRVLLVDDSRLARNFIRRVLESMGLVKIDEAENGAFAVTALKDNPYDLVVTDYNMPEMDGRELAEFVRFNPETSHIPIIMVTSEANSAHMSNIHQTGVNAMCDKPFEANEVRRMLASLLNH